MEYDSQFKNNKKIDIGSKSATATVKPKTRIKDRKCCKSKQNNTVKKSCKQRQSKSRKSSGISNQAVVNGKFPLLATVKEAGDMVKVQRRIKTIKGKSLTIEPSKRSSNVPIKNEATQNNISDLSTSIFNSNASGENLESQSDFEDILKKPSRFKDSSIKPVKKEQGTYQMNKVARKTVQKGHMKTPPELEFEKKNPNSLPSKKTVEVQLIEHPVSRHMVEIPTNRNTDNSGIIKRTRIFTPYTEVYEDLFAMHKTVTDGTEAVEGVQKDENTVNEYLDISHPPGINNNKIERCTFRHADYQRNQKCKNNSHSSPTNCISCDFANISANNAPFKLDHTPLSKTEVILPDVESKPISKSSHCKASKTVQCSTPKLSIPRNMLEEDVHKDHLTLNGVNYTAINAKILIPMYNPIDYLGMSVPKPLLLTSRDIRHTPKTLKEYKIRQLS